MTPSQPTDAVWEAPQIREADGNSEIDFRDCIVQLSDGLVKSYYDKERRLTLQPAADSIDEWLVVDEHGTNTGQRWKGFIAFDGKELIIHQERHARMKLYRLDGSIETQYRNARVTELPGSRSTDYTDGILAVENLVDNQLRAPFEDFSITRQSDGSAYVSVSGGEPVPEEEWLESQSRSNAFHEAVEAYREHLKHWSDLMPVHESLHLHGPPGIGEAEPGRSFRRPQGNKPADFRECRKTDFADGTCLYQYCGRLGGAPFSGHEILSVDGLVLARSVKYNQAQRINCQGGSGERLNLEGVIGIEILFDPDALIYVSTVSFDDGSQKDFASEPAAPAPW
jgi:hypothetical protein